MEKVSIEQYLGKVIEGDCLSTMRQWPAGCINCCITSPPYWGLRDYGVDDQLGLEKTPAEYVDKMVEVFREVRRVLKKDGTLFLNLGDSYSSHKDCKSVSDSLRVGGKSETANVIDKGKSNSRNGKMLKSVGLKNKDLIGIPWMVAFALRADGWYLRQDIIWAKPNPMPESVTDRCTKSHEYIFLLSKSAKYYFDNEAIQEKAVESNAARPRMGQGPNTQYNQKRKPRQFGASNPEGTFRQDVGNTFEDNGFKNKRDVWTVPTKAYSDAHFATYPPKLIEPCILAGCPKGGIVLDPFGGTCTTAEVAIKLGRNYMCCELNEEYCKLARLRIAAAESGISVQELKNGQQALF
jgi:DNA modification methylase